MVKGKEKRSRSRTRSRSPWGSGDKNSDIEMETNIEKERTVGQKDMIKKVKQTKDMSKITDTVGVNAPGGEVIVTDEGWKTRSIRSSTKSKDHGDESSGSCCVKENGLNHLQKGKSQSSLSLNNACKIVADSGSSSAHETISSSLLKDSGLSSEIYYNLDGNFTKKSDLNADRLSELFNDKQQRFEVDFKGECKIKCKLSVNNVTSNKGKNYVKILTWYNSNRIYPVTVKMLRVNLAELTICNCNEANSCLEIIDKVPDKVKMVSGFIDKRSVISRGVITDWPYDIPQLRKEIINKT
ncbi:hypothetical protein RF55_20787 [Lasius niger]|uniref:Uncharacterized protein n=1 Tax=Lasius niger TaxID=67767 RepID=A0A0J7MRK9_LASNI|nr:hypothetical protein RF55_20787 [Lasius niger]